jgi:DNA-binding transcriptional regulator YhcF (GntR family)
MTHLHGRERERIVETIDELRAAEAAPVYVLIQRAVRMLVARGELVAGQRLPTVRALAQQLEVAIKTVARAYAALASDGVIVSRGGAGSVIGAPARGTQRTTDERLQRVARQVAAYGLALGHAPPEIMHAVRAVLAALGRPQAAAGETRIPGRYVNRI